MTESDVLVGLALILTGVFLWHVARWQRDEIRDKKAEAEREKKYGPLESPAEYEARWDREQERAKEVQEFITGLGGCFDGKDLGPPPEIDAVRSGAPSMLAALLCLEWTKLDRAICMACWGTRGCPYCHNCPVCCFNQTGKVVHGPKCAIDHALTSAGLAGWEARARARARMFRDEKGDVVAA